MKADTKKTTVTKTEIENKHYIIEGACIDEIVSFCLNHIRVISQDFYKNEIKSDLLNQGFSWIDRHAGVGNYYEVKLIK